MKNVRSDWIQIFLFIYLCSPSSAVKLPGDDEMTGKLVHIDKSDWTELRDLYRLDWPKYTVTYYILDNFIRWVRLEPDFKHLQIYSLNGDWRRDGTFIAIHRNKLYLNTVSSSTDRVFKSLQLVDYRHGLSLSMISSESLRDVVLKTVEAKQLSYKNFSYLVYHMPQEEAANLDVHIPDEVITRPLVDSDCETVNNVLSYKSEGNLQLLKIQRRLNPSIGVFTKEDKLIAWSFRMQTGAIGALQVDPDYRRRGYGLYICKAMSKLIGDRGDDVLAYVDGTNTPSLKLFEKCGFTIVGTIYRTVTGPCYPFEWKDAFY